jgi:hypothetical protein
MPAPFAVSVGTSATLIIAGNEARTSIYIENSAGDGTVLVLGQDTTLTTANGIEIADGGLVMEDMGNRLWKGDWYGIVAAGTADVRVWERTNRG